MPPAVTALVMVDAESGPYAHPSSDLIRRNRQWIDVIRATLIRESRHNRGVLLPCVRHREYDEVLRLFTARRTCLTVRQQERMFQLRALWGLRKLVKIEQNVEYKPTTVYNFHLVQYFLQEILFVFSSKFHKYI